MTVFSHTAQRFPEDWAEITIEFTTGDLLTICKSLFGSESYLGNFSLEKQSGLEQEEKNANSTVVVTKKV